MRTPHRRPETTDKAVRSARPAPATGPVKVEPGRKERIKLTRDEKALSDVLPFTAEDVRNANLDEARRLVRESEESAAVLARIFNGE